MTVCLLPCRSRTKARRLRKTGETGCAGRRRNEFGLTFYETLGGKKGGAAAATQAGAMKDKPSGNLRGTILLRPGSAAETGAVGGDLPAGRCGKRHSSGSRRRRGWEEAEPLSREKAAGVRGKGRGMPVGNRRQERRSFRAKGRFEVQVAAYREKSAGGTDW